MPFNGEKQCVGEDQPSDSDSSQFSESMASLSDYECSRQSFTSDSSSKSSSPASTSPPRVVTFDEVMAAARNLSNMTLAHEIAINENFQLKQDAFPENSLASRVKHIVHQAFWDVLESELNAEPPEYEHAIKLFEEIREDKSVAFSLSGALDQTTEWIRESVNEELLSLSETALTPGAENSSKPSLSPTLVLNNSYLKLLQWDYQKKELPETLMTDGARLQELTEKLNQLKIIACLSLITNNMVGALTEGLPELANRLKRISVVLLEGMNKETFNLKEVLNSIGVQTCVEVNKALVERDLSILNAEVQANLIGQFSSIEKEDNPIWSLIDKRIQLYMKSLLCLPSPQKCMPPVPGGLAIIQQELEVLGSQYANIVNLNKQVYGPFYANILRKLLFGEEAMGKADASSSN
ncbi:T-complex protein 11-like protein 2 [Leptonychotes weddellii]|uniref:T-complex protein 11-like protein 2 n=1 Tax=Leptonychotes weddellii TaxID=9713 RepID=A0A7F8QJV3_LEPWE|nr:T-complex protein 11-like protein 2 [Leptonychotes weddellii]